MSQHWQEIEFPSGDNLINIDVQDNPEGKDRFFTISEIFPQIQDQNFVVIHEDALNQVIEGLEKVRAYLNSTRK